MEMINDRKVLDGKLLAFFWLVLVLVLLMNDHLFVCSKPAESNSVQSAIIKSADQLFESESVGGLHSIPPSTDGPLKIYVGFYIESMGTLKAETMDYDMDMYLRLNWRDPRLNHSGGQKLLTKESSKNLWYPDLFFANAKTAEYQTVTMPNFAVYVHGDGDVAYSSRVTLNLACNLDLVHYPLDEQHCKVKIMSYSNPENLLTVKWFTQDPISYNKEIDLPEFYFIGLEDSYCNGTSQYAVSEHKKNDGLIVVISWVSFWIDATAVPARISLSFTTLLTLATQGTGIRVALPAVSYAKAIDYWFGVCMLFVFCALIEFAMVNSLMRESKKLSDLATSVNAQALAAEEMENGNESPNVLSTKTIATEISSLMISPLDDTDLLQNQHLQNILRHRRKSSRPMQNYGNFAKTSKEAAKKAMKVDRICRVVFPSAFCLFNIFYWTFFVYY